MSTVSERASSCRVSRTRVASIMCPLGASCVRLSSEYRSEKEYEEVSAVTEQIEKVVNAYMVEIQKLNQCGLSVSSSRSLGKSWRRLLSSSYRQCLISLIPEGSARGRHAEGRVKGQRRRTGAHHQRRPKTSSASTSSVLAAKPHTRPYA
jgi:hypothetical protein